MLIGISIPCSSEIEEDLRRSETQIGWNCEYKIKTVEVSQNRSRSMNSVATKEEIIKAILKLDKWRDIEDILDSIFNTRNLVFVKWLKDNSSKFIK